MTIEKLIPFMAFARDHIAADVTVQRVLVLLHVALKEGQSHSELAQALPGISVTAMSRNLADLSALTSRKTEGPGLIEQRIDSHNLRTRRVYLTAKGKALVKRWRKTVPQQ